MHVETGEAGEWPSIVSLEHARVDGRSLDVTTYLSLWSKERTLPHKPGNSTLFTSSPPHFCRFVVLR
jgi:hypothetical protein